MRELPETGPIGGVYPDIDGDEYREALDGDSFERLQIYSHAEKPPRWKPELTRREFFDKYPGLVRDGGCYDVYCSQCSQRIAWWVEPASPHERGTAYKRPGWNEFQEAEAWGDHVERCDPRRWARDQEAERWAAERERRRRGRDPLLVVLWALIASEQWKRADRRRRRWRERREAAETGGVS